MQIFPSPHDDFTRSFFGVAHGTALSRREGQRIGGAVTNIVRREYNCLGEFPTNQVKKLKTGPARPSASHFKLRRASKRRPSPPLPALPLARFVEIARRLSPAWALASRRPLRVLGFEQGLPQCTAQPWRHLEHAQRPLFLPPQPPTSPGLSRRRQPRLRACPGPTLLRARAGSGICQGTQAPASAPPRRPWPSPPPFAAAAASEASFASRTDTRQHGSPSRARRPRGHSVGRAGRPSRHKSTGHSVGRAGRPSRPKSTGHSVGHAGRPSRPKSTGHSVGRAGRPSRPKRAGRPPICLPSLFATSRRGRSEVMHPRFRVERAAGPMRRRPRIDSAEVTASGARDADGGAGRRFRIRVARTRTTQVGAGRRRPHCGFREASRAARSQPRTVVACVFKPFQTSESSAARPSGFGCDPCAAVRGRRGCARRPCRLICNSFSARRGAAPRHWASTPPPPSIAVHLRRGAPQRPRQRPRRTGAERR